jgi:hypothetical protein
MDMYYHHPVPVVNTERILRKRYLTLVLGSITVVVVYRMGLWNN